METVKVDYTNIRNYLKNSAPYIFVDKATVIPGVSALGVKNFTHNEWFFSCHFEDEPIVPGVFQIEAITQTAALSIHTLDIMGNKKILIKNVNGEFIRGVYPGDQLFVNTVIESFRRGIIKGSGEAYVLNQDEKIVTCKASFQMIVPDMLVIISK